VSDAHRLALSALLLGFVGPTPPAWLLDALAHGLGGVVLFGSNLGDGRDVAQLTDRLRAAAGRDIVLALDEEGGDVTRLDTVRGSASPGAAALGFLADADATETAYAAIGARLVEAGLTVDLAPVADVNIDPCNPVIGVRSFGADAALVARQVAAAVRGLQRTGVAACVKHFPGHGATTADSHHEVPTLTRTDAQLRAVELPPFRAGIEAGARAVMTGHLRAPALDAANLATVSPAINRNLLRGELGFTGTVVTDALEMRALADTLGMAGGFVAALTAGADAMETGAQDYPDLVAAIPDAVERALDDGTLTLARLRDAAARTAALAELSALPVAAAAERADRLARDVWGRCLEQIGVLPHLDRPLVVEARPPDGMASGALPWSFADALRARLPDVEEATARGSADVDRLLATSGSSAAQGTRRTVVAVVRDPLRHPWQSALMTRADVVVDVGWPTDAPANLPVVRTRGVAPDLLRAAADLLASA
jgi:beta-N-acetylhexosaminidase